MKVLVIGGGGREHAICWQLARHTPGIELFCAPGSDGIEVHATRVPVAVDEIQKLADFAHGVGIDLTIVGPELPLSLGVVDEFQSRDLTIFGPSRDASQLESSKAFAKRFMKRHGIPTGEFEVVHDEASAKGAVKKLGLPVAMKADGLAAGKGVLLVHDRRQLAEACNVFFGERRFGASGDQVLVETFLEGEEVSFIGLSDGRRLLPLATSKDYKRIGDGDSGPNTGGMGAHSPSGVVAASEARYVLERVMHRTIEGMAADGVPFVGVLYAGVMLTDQGPQVLEFNVRLGDPEAQALLLRLEDDLAARLEAGARGDFGTSRLGFRKCASACLVLAADGYPEKPNTGEVIRGLDEAIGHKDVEVFHAGTARVNGGYTVTGGRVLNVCATGPELHSALSRAYEAASEIRWPGRQLRTDIGRRVLESHEIQESGIISVARDARGDE